MIRIALEGDFVAKECAIASLHTDHRNPRALLEPVIEVLRGTENVQAAKRAAGFVGQFGARGDAGAVLGAMTRLKPAEPSAFVSALRILTGVDLGNDPRAWQDCWERYGGVIRPWILTPGDLVANTDQQVVQAVGGLYSSNPTERLNAVKALSLAGRQALPAVPHLVQVMGGEDIRDAGQADRIAGAAAEALAKLQQTEATEALLRALDDLHTRRQAAAATALGQMREPQALDRLLSLMASEDQGVSRAAIDAVGGFGDAGAEALAGLAGKPDVRARRDAAIALGRSKSRKAIGPLIALLGDEVPGVRYHVAESLGRLGFPDGVGPLADALTDKDANVRTKAAWALGQLKDSRAAEALC